MKIYGPIEEVSLEVLSSDPTNKPKGRMYFNSTDSKAKISDGSTFDDFVTTTAIAGLDDNTRRDATAVPVGVDTLAISFSSDLSSSNYAAVVTMENTTDTDPIFFTPLVQSKTVSGFTIKLNGNTDTANYIANWSAQLDN